MVYNVSMVQFSADIPEENYKDLKKLSERSGNTMRSHLRDAIAEYIERNRERIRR